MQKLNLTQWGHVVPSGAEIALWDFETNEFIIRINLSEVFSGVEVAEVPEAVALAPYLSEVAASVGIEEAALQNKRVAELASNWQINSNTATGELELVDTAYPYLGSIAVGRSVVNENGQNVIEWEPRYQVQENVRLVEMSLAEDDDIGKEPVPFYVLPNDSITVENMDLTLNLATVMSADPDDPHHTLTRYEFTEDFEQRFAAFANKYMQDYRGHEITIRLVDDQDPTTLSHLRALTLENDTFIQHATWFHDNPAHAFGGRPVVDNRLFFNAFFARGLAQNPQEMGYGISGALIRSLIYIESKTYPWRGGNPYGKIPDKNQMIGDLGLDTPDSTVPIVEVYTPN
jgi:hypothetical protein